MSEQSQNKPVKPLGRKAYEKLVDSVVIRKAVAALAVGAALGPAAAGAKMIKDEASPAKVIQPLKASSSSANKFSVSMPEDGSGASGLDGLAKKHHTPEHHKPKHHKKKHHRKPPTATPIPPTETAPAQIDLHPENLPSALTPEVVSTLESNAGFIPNMDNCSFYAIRDSAQQNDPVVGGFFAKHCGALPADGNLTTDKSGNLVYDYPSGPLTAYIGSSLGTTAEPGDAQSVGNIAYMYVDQTNTNDLGVFVLANQDPNNVLTLAQDQMMPVSQSSALAEGSVLVSRGMPQYQPGNPGPLRMQNTAMSVLGNMDWTMTDAINSTENTTENLNVEVAAMPLTPDGSECSWGESGTVALVVEPNGQLDPIGVLSGFNDFGYLYNKSNLTEGQAILNQYESQFNTSLSGYSGLCAFNGVMGTAESGAQFIPVANY